MQLLDEPLTVAEGSEAGEFESGNFMRGLNVDEFTLELYELHDFQPLTAPFTNVGYRVYDPTWRPYLVFEGRDLQLRAGTVIDGPLAFMQLMSQFKERNQQKSYTPNQAYWFGERAEVLDRVYEELTEQHSLIPKEGAPSWGCLDYLEDEHEYLDCPDCQDNWLQQLDWQSDIGSELWLAPEGSQATISLQIELVLPVPVGKQMKPLPQASILLREALVNWIVQQTDNGTKPENLMLDLMLSAMRVRKISKANHDGDKT